MLKVLIIIVFIIIAIFLCDIMRMADDGDDDYDEFE